MLITYTGKVQLRCTLQLYNTYIILCALYYFNLSYLKDTQRVNIIKVANKLVYFPFYC